jgi:cysteinyl-tRNA synthetase
MKETHPMLELYNTMSRKKEVFRPIDDQTVKMFTCGPSIYGRTHVGNYRTFLWEDVLQRYFEYQGYRVDRVLNFTDVEDKAIAEAEKEGTDIQELTGRMADRFFQDAVLLGIKLPETIPRSSTSVDQAVKLIETLMDKKYAYRHGKDIFFDPLKFEGFGKLFRLDMTRWPREKKRFRKDTYPGRRWNLGDFILWHGFREGEKVFWDTGIGRGRPSWNIQDPAMITEHLGFSIDISCGGIDNLYRHHDYNLAVIEAASGREFARYWVHMEHLLVDGKKMSKSMGNIVYPDDLLDKGYNGRHIRFYLLYGQHGKTINLTEGNLQRASRKLDLFMGMAAKLTAARSSSDEPVASDTGAEEFIKRVTGDFEKCMNDDLDVKAAFDALHEILSRLVALKEAGKLSREDSRRVEQNLRKVDEVLKFIFP